MTTDLCGRAYAKLDELKEGDKVQVDSCFGCIPDYAIRKVFRTKTGELAIKCGGPDDTKTAPQTHTHLLEGQLNRLGFLVGVYHV